MTTTPPEGQPTTEPQTGQAPGPADVDTPPTTADFYVAPDDDDTKGHAVYDVTLGQFVSGVMSKADAGKARRELADTGITEGHDLDVRPV